ncbi:hypothetical protein MBENS4_2024 [Novosphingobium sp. MBES04]|nr:hypothetical protein MBENS4_2024 [Novosphingobium sp. MBES04]
MHAREQRLLGQHIEVLADGLGGHIEPCGEIVDLDAARAARDLQDARAPARHDIALAVLDARVRAHAPAAPVMAPP